MQYIFENFIIEEGLEYMEMGSNSSGLHLYLLSCQLRNWTRVAGVHRGEA